MEAEPLHRAHAGEDILREPVPDTGGSPEYCVRPRRAGEVATIRLGQYGWVVCGRHNAAACTVRATTAAPRDRDEASPRSRAYLDAEEEREGASLRQRLDSASSPRLTTPSSPRRPRRRRGAPARRGCRAARSSTPTGRAPLDEVEADTGRIASPLPGAARTSLSPARVSLDEAEAAADAITRSGEAILTGDVARDLARQTTHTDSSVVVMIDTPADGGTLVRGGVRGAAKKAVADVFLGDANRNDFMARFMLAIELGPAYWVRELIDWMYARDRDRDNWSWLGVVGYPIQQKDSTCAICGTLVCLEARHRLDFERRHGFKTFPYRIPAETVADLKDLCRERRVWTARYGADEEKVLELIQAAGGSAVAGVPGWKPCSLQVKSWEYHKNSVRQPIPLSDLAKMIHKKGPLLGSLTVDQEYYYPGWKDRVYRGVPRTYKGATHHLVVCTGYHFGILPAALRNQQFQRTQRHRRWLTETELYIEVVDNHAPDGPVRWILSTAFTGFVEVHVQPLDATELRVKKPSLWRCLLDTLSPRHRP